MDHGTGLSRRLTKALAVGLVAGLVGGLFALSSLGGSFERNLGLGWLFERRGPIAPPANVAVVAIDSRTGGLAGLPPLPREWSRSAHARIVDELSRRGASAIAFDMQFDRAHDPEGDQALAAAIARSDRTALIHLVTGKQQPVFAPDGRPSGTVWVEGIVEPIESLHLAAKAEAAFPLPKIDAAVFEFWAFKESLGDAPTLPAVMLQLHALPDWPAWRAGLERLQLPELAGLPDKSTDVGRAESVATLMHSLRDGLRRHPELADVLVAGFDPADPGAARLKALAAMYAGDPHRTLNFYGPPGTIPTVPYQQVLSGETTFDFHDKVVFVGFSDLYDPGQPDRFYTVFTSNDGVDLSGVEIAATAFANLLSDRSIVPLDVAPTFASLLLFGLVIGALAYALPALIGVPLVLALGLGWALAGQELFERQQLWLPMATPLLLQLPLALFLGLIAQYLLERRRRQHASQALSYYLPEQVARALTENSAHPDAYNRVVWGTCLATDMSGFSTISEQLPPDQLARFLNAYFDTLAKALRLHGVDITEFRADAIMCAWTADTASLQPRRQAVLAAQAAAEAIEIFKTDHSQLSSALRIGLHVGHFFVGHAGGGGHFVFSIVGDTANTASRLESLNKHLGTSILASSEVVEGLEDQMLMRPLGAFRLMGKGEAIRVVEVITVNDKATSAQLAMVAAFAQALDIYRDGELAAALAAFETFQTSYPADGPARFFISHCQRLLKAEQVPPSPRAVEMDSK